MSQFFFRALPVITAKDATMDFEQLTFALNKGDLEVNAQGELKLKAPEAFKGVEALGFTNAWKNFEAGRKAEYRKNPLGTVELRGVISAGESGKAAFTLPAGYRPKEAKNFIVQAASNTGIIEVAATGVVTPNSVGGEVKTDCWLDQVLFSVE